MPHLAKRLFAASVVAIVAIAALGCGGPKDEVLVQTPEAAAELEAYNEQMDKPSEGI